ncbi:elongation of very long chain fatty acids protein 7 isoform X1 [Neodiprion virginianus]|uniref:elongation of very long chain fatty acids protein 7 isoform X1 n=1 Tax=Neodiprion virginianus TaxID=2961670 RepID=UPI001EE70AA0|nr:elongation of very long chain fatty acids protein 7 isoform X1 [Neodiprion virginianus]
MISPSYHAPCSPTLLVLSITSQSRSSDLPVLNYQLSRSTSISTFLSDAWSLLGLNCSTYCNCCTRCSRRSVTFTATVDRHIDICFFRVAPHWPTTSSNPMVDTWLLMGSPGPILGILALYLTFVLKVGPKIMANRPAYELKNLMILYNGAQVIFSLWLCSLTFQVDLLQLIIVEGCSHDEKVVNNPLQLALSTGAWWYFFAKITELLDTVFFVLRKKQNQVTFLHVYHHTITALFSWCYLKLLPGEQGIVIGFLNSLVHVVMYSYYLIAALGPAYRKYLWWKKYMTWMQLIQFGVMLCYLTYLLAIDCKLPKALTYFFATNVTIFIYLFSDFYRKSYTKKTA